jgi:hypothetical protein
MKFVNFFAILLLACSCSAAPSGEVSSEKSEVTADVTSALAGETEVTGDGARSKKSPAGPQTICSEVRTVEGRSYLQCENTLDTEVAGTAHSYASYSPAPSYAAPSYSAPAYSAPPAYKVDNILEQK